MKISRPLVFAVTLGLLAACGNSPPPAPPQTGAVQVAISPTQATVAPGGSQQFTATVTGSTNAAVSWTATCGTVDASGLYTAPSAAGSCQVKATSAADASRSASATVTVKVNGVAVAVSPTSGGVIVGGSGPTFTASVTGTTNTGVTWSLQEGASGGTLTPSGNSASYTAPCAPGTYHVVATSVADGTKSAQATLTVTDVTVAVTPSSATVDQGDSQNFSASVTGTSDQAVTWSIQEGAPGGTLTPSGNSASYTAPASAGAYHVVASSDATTCAAGTATVTVPGATGLAYVDPPGTGWRLVRDPSSTATHLILDLLGPSGGSGRGVGLTLTVDDTQAAWAKVTAGDPEFVTNVAYSLGASPLLFQSAVEGSGELRVGVFQKGTTAAAVSYSGTLLQLALDYAGSGPGNGTPVSLSVTLSHELTPSPGGLSPITVAVGQLAAQ